MSTESQPHEKPERTNKEELFGLAERFIGEASDWTIVEDATPEPKPKPRTPRVRKEKPDPGARTR